MRLAGKSSSNFKHKSSNGVFFQNFIQFFYISTLCRKTNFAQFYFVFCCFAETCDNFARFVFLNKTKNRRKKLLLQVNLKNLKFINLNVQCVLNVRTLFANSCDVSLYCRCSQIFKKMK